MIKKSDVIIINKDTVEDSRNNIWPYNAVTIERDWFNVFVAWNETQSIELGRFRTLCEALEAVKEHAAKIEE